LTGMALALASAGRWQLRPKPVGQVSLRVSRQSVTRRAAPLAAVAQGAQQPLQPWQAVRLHEELAKGRRQVKVRELSGELQMEREEITQWLKDFGALPDSTRDSMREAAIAAYSANKERKAVLKSEREAAAAAKKLSFKERQADGGDFAKKRMSRAARDTLESVWEKTRWPSEEVIQGVYKLHRISRRKTLDWFAERRAQESSGQRGRRKEREEKRFMEEKYGDGERPRE